jgi:uncharacterized protein (TIGR03067 family)
MKTRLAGLVLLGVALALSEVAAGGDAKAELKKFEGTWAVELAVKRGKPSPGAKVDQLRLTFAGDKVTILGEGGKEIQATFKIDPSQKPHQINVAFDGNTIEGIYAFEGGKLKICTAQTGRDRPTEFKSTKESGAELLVLKRVKK